MPRHFSKQPKKSKYNDFIEEFLTNTNKKKMEQNFYGFYESKRKS